MIKISRGIGSTACLEFNYRQVSGATSGCLTHTIFASSLLSAACSIVSHRIMPPLYTRVVPIMSRTATRGMHTRTKAFLWLLEAAIRRMVFLAEPRFSNVRKRKHRYPEGVFDRRKLGASKGEEYPWITPWEQSFRGPTCGHGTTLPAFPRFSIHGSVSRFLSFRIVRPTNANRCRWFSRNSRRFQRLDRAMNYLGRGKHCFVNRREAFDDPRNATVLLFFFPSTRERRKCRRSHFPATFWESRVARAFRREV